MTTIEETLPPWAAEPMTEAELNAHVEAMELADEAEDDTHRPWAINSTGEAEWAMAFVASIDTQLDAIHRQEVEWREQLETWLADTIRQPMARRFFFVGALVDYQRRRRQEDPRAKTLPLPSGVVKSKLKPEHVSVVDDQVLCEWALEHAPNEVETIHRVPVKNLKSMAEIVEEVVLERWRVVLACSHQMDLSGGPEEPPEKGEILYCPHCPTVEIGRVPSSAIESVEADYVTRKVVRHCESGDELPGVGIEPESISVTVSPVVAS